MAATIARSSKTQEDGFIRVMRIKIGVQGVGLIASKGGILTDVCFTIGMHHLSKGKKDCKSRYWRRLYLEPSGKSRAGWQLFDALNEALKIKK